MTNTAGRRLLRAYLDANIGQQRLADQLGVKQSAISLWKSGKARPKAEHRVLLRELLNIPEESWLTTPELREVRKLRGKFEARATGTEG